MRNMIEYSLWPGNVKRIPMGYIYLQRVINGGNIKKGIARIWNALKCDKVSISYSNARLSAARCFARPASIPRQRGNLDLLWTPFAG